MAFYRSSYSLKMDALCFDDNKEGLEVKSAEEFPTSNFSGMDDKFGDPQVLPRVGDQYQAEIPSLNPAPHLSQLIKKTRDSEVTINIPESLSLGLPIPLTWAYCKFRRSSGTLESLTSEEGQVISENECSKVKVESQTALLGEGKNMGGFSNYQSSFKCDETDIDSYLELKTELYQPRGKYLLPGLLVDQSWTDIDYNSFLLGLYVFGKNLNFLKRFVGSKNMGDVLSFYYGKFYRSKEYCRWSECWKLRSRRCIYGQKIFTGWRQQELLSRLFSHVSGECQTMLVELSRKFGEGKMPFEEYLFALKDAVGINLLIAAVGIGKGKQDLTGTAVEPRKNNRLFSVRSEIPIGKACSSLTSAEIIKFLTGDFRLSKARSSDLFWEAVWPRLLAKGWHSEQPKDHIVSGSKQSLVFLVPGVKKFSRRLVKGNHYFDSVCDVLKKVASEPGLIEIEIQATEGSVDRENRQDKGDLNGLSKRQQFHYLQPLSSKCNQDLKKFTVVDTSMVYDLGQYKVRKLRSLPFETMSISTISSYCTGSEQDASEDSGDQAEQANSSNPVEEFSDKGVSIDSSDCTNIPEALNATILEVENHKSHSDLHSDEHSRKINEHQFIQKVTFGCNNGEFSHCTESTSVGRKFDLNGSTSQSNLGEASEDMVSSLSLENLSFPSYQSKGSPIMSNEGIGTENHLVGEVYAEKRETRMLIDLNFPQVSPELGIEMEIPSSMIIVQNDNQCGNTSSSSSEITHLNEIQEFPDGHREQQSIIANRRQSTRNRPLTTKALEALEYRFLNSKRKRKNSESSLNNSKSQYLRVSSATIVSDTCDNGNGNAMAGTRVEGENEIHKYSYSINLKSEAHYNL